MRLTECYFIPTITDAGVAELYRFTESILYKAGRNIPPKDYEDVRQAMILACLEKLPRYDISKGIPLGGYLYWPCRGAISVWANKHQRELPFSEPMVEWIDGKRVMK